MNGFFFAVRKRLRDGFHEPLDVRGKAAARMAAHRIRAALRETQGCSVPNTGDGNFETPVSALIPLDTVGDLTPFVADFNGDGYPDVVLGSGLSSPLFLDIGATVQATGAR